MRIMQRQTNILLRRIARKLEIKATMKLSCRKAFCKSVCIFVSGLLESYINKDKKTFGLILFNPALFSTLEVNSCTIKGN